MKTADASYYIDSRKPEAEELLSLRLSQLLARYPLPPVYLCIGSDRVTGDSLGPFVGTLLLKSQPALPVLGTLTDPVHALNLRDTLCFLSEKFSGHPVVAIDASLGSRMHQEFLTIGSGSLEPGAGVDKILGSAGDLFITGIVAPTGPLPQLNLQTVRLSLVMRFAECIAKAVISCCPYKEPFLKA